MLRALPPITNKVARYFLVGGKTRNIAIQLVLQLPVLPHLLPMCAYESENPK